MPPSPSREELSRPTKVFEAGAIACLDHDAPAFRRLDGRRERGFHCGDGIFGAHDHGRRLADAFAESHACAVPEKEILLNNGLADLRSCRKSDIGGDASLRRPICTSMLPFPIANRAPSAREYFSCGDQHEVFMNGQCRTLRLCRTDHDMPCPSSSAVARAARFFALSCRCTGSIATSSEAAITKSDANSCPPRGLSHGEAILYLGEGSMLMLRWSRMGGCPA